MKITLISLHGLLRGRDLEIGRDADNGGQIIYVMELARALQSRPDVDHVILITRLIDDHRNRRINAGYQLWGLLTLFLWMKRWNIEVSPDVVPDNLPTLHHKLDSL